MATQTIYTNNDTYDDQANPTTIHGSNSTIILEDSSTQFKNGYVGFDITSTPVASNINSVYLYLYHPNTEGSDTDGLFKRTTTSWSESTLTWNNKPTNTLFNHVWLYPLPSGNAAWFSVDVTEMYKDAKNGGNFFGVSILCDSATTGSYTLSSKESIYDPYISIDYITTDYYVKTTGNDSLDGQSWANAWATINKAATTVADGITVHIGFGDYITEPASNKIAPQNVGTLGIYYLPETVTTGGGTGTVSVEQNA